jgi:hypothetical protein
MDHWQQYHTFSLLIRSAANSVKFTVLLWWPGEGCIGYKDDDISGLLGSILRTGGVPARVRSIPAGILWLYLLACCRRWAVAVPAGGTPAWRLAQQLQCNAGCPTRWVHAKVCVTDDKVLV